MQKLFFAFVALCLAGPAVAKPGLWVIRDGDTELTLFGTVHALPKGTDWLSPAITKQLGSANSIVLETIIPDDPAAMGALVTDLGLSPGLKPLAKRLPPDVAASVAPLAIEAGIPPAALDRMETWLAALTLSQAALARIGISGETGVEAAITFRAKAAHQPLVGLETPEQQMRYLDSLPEADQVVMLTSALADVGDARTETERLTNMWLAGDVDGLARAFAEEAAGSPRLQKVLITDRNARWADWISGVMKQPGKIFMAVGAGHFGGDEGLLALLKARGLMVERIE